MKFTHGVWFDRENTQIYNAVEVDSVSSPPSNPGSIRALCTTKHVAQRGDTLNHPTITLQLSSPAQDIVAGTVWHFSGARDDEPRFELFPDEIRDAEARSGIEVQHDDEAGMSSLRSGGLKAVLNRNAKKFRIGFESAASAAGGTNVEGSSASRQLTDLGYASVQYIVAPPSHPTPSPPVATTLADTYYRAPPTNSKQPYISLSFGLQPGEHVYGLGERFGPLVKNGQEIDIWNEDGGTSTPYTYKNIPFYLTSRGYGVFFDHSDLLSVEVQNEHQAKVQVTIQGEQLRFFIIHGPTPKEVLSKYAILTGHPPLPPAWTFGLYLSTSFLTDYDEQTVTKQLDGMRDRGIPMSVLHFDCFWMKGHTWTSFIFDPKYFPDPKAFLTRLHDRGLKVCVWINSYIAQESEIFTEAMTKGYLIKRRDGSVWQSDQWQAGMGVVDFTNPEAVKWYTAHLHTLIDLGVDTFKTDFGERIPWEDVVYHDGMSPRAGHNFYSFLYNKTVFEAIESKLGPGSGALFARSATAGGQRFPVHWGGDCESTWSGMAQSLRGGLSLGLSGFGFWSHDMAGFMGEGLDDAVPQAAIYKRWAQFGLLSSHSRLHGSHSYRVPWLVDEEAVSVLRAFSRLKNRLMPYLFVQAIDAHTKGWPMLRAMVLEFPEDRTCQVLDAQYMLGRSLLVAPVFDEEGWVEYYLPKGRWTGLLDGRVREGPGWVKERFDSFHMPLLVREDSAILMGTEERPDYDWAGDLTAVVVGAVSDAAKERGLEVRVPDAKRPGEIAGTVTIKFEGDSPKASCSDGVSAPDVLLFTESSHVWSGVDVTVAHR